ncbi:hypothetical protein [Sorangium cellulosum]|uniref:Uncharacterized protein n=2 Tax=Sorangium cellulosum TaxID=56 RepID=A0A150TNZ4_SORCE|nr:hypothetical protein [Sorangium cellulosum]AGP38530.1 hypothetical protein SCE1572_31080 [Sorangium cellulosum So0157-2]KYG06421.1 hypothetical protein BE21_03210 [Sorangium cellulosum]
MELSRLLDELTLAANRVGIAVRMEAFDPHLSDARNPRGGLCTVLGRRVILVDANASLPDRIATVAAALARVDLESVFLPPIVRATIGAHARGARPPAPTPGEPVRLPTRQGKRGRASTLLPLARTKWRNS